MNKETIREFLKPTTGMIVWSVILFVIASCIAYTFYVEMSSRSYYSNIYGAPLPFYLESAEDSPCISQGSIVNLFIDLFLWYLIILVIVSINRKSRIIKIAGFIIVGLIISGLIIASSTYHILLGGYVFGTKHLEYVPGEIIVEFHDNVTEQEAIAWIEFYESEIELISYDHKYCTAKVKVPEGEEQEWVELFKNESVVEDVYRSPFITLY